MTHHDTPQFPIGLQWTGYGPKSDRTYTLIDYLVTRTMGGQIVRARYAASYGFMGRFKIDDDILPITIQKAIADGRVVNPELLKA